MAMAIVIATIAKTWSSPLVPKQIDCRRACKSPWIYGWIEQPPAKSTNKRLVLTRLRSDTVGWGLEKNAQIECDQHASKIRQTKTPQKDVDKTIAWFLNWLS
eukprot:5077845-Heterocapsa_arctica.AAC.1